MNTYQSLALACLCSLSTLSQLSYAQSVSINLDVVGLNSNQTQANQTLESACASIAASNSTTPAAMDLLNTCSLLDSLDDEDPALAAELDRLIPEEAFAIGDMLTIASDSQNTNVIARLDSLRQVDTSALYDEQINTKASGGAAAAPDFSKLQAFVSGQVSTGDLEGGRLQQDADLSSSQITVGADYRLSNDFVVGTAIGVTQQKTDFSNTAGSSELAGNNLSIFGTYSRESLGYLDVVLDIGRNDFDVSRQINSDDNNPVMAASSTDSSNFSLTAGIGKNFNVFKLGVRPYVRSSFTRASVDGYSERADSNLPGFGSTLNVSSQSISSQTLTAGVSVSQVISTRRAVLVPNLSIETESERNRDKDPLNVFFLADPDQQTFSVEGEERDSNYANIGLGGTAVFTKGRSAFAYYEKRLADRYVSQYWLKAGLRLEF